MNDDRSLFAGEEPGQPIRRQHDVATGIVGNGNPINPRITTKLLAQFNNLAGLLRCHEASRSYQFRSVAEPFAIKPLSESSGFLWSIHPIFFEMTAPSHPVNRDGYALEIRCPG